jgi:hypothetical protein
MTESQQVLEWITEGEIKGRIVEKVESLLRVLQKKFPPGPPADLVAVIQSCPTVTSWPSGSTPPLMPKVWTISGER